MFTFWSGLSIGIVLGVVLWNAGARLGNAMVGTPSASHNTARVETATRLLKCFVNFWHSDDTEPNDVALAIVETEKFLSDVAASPVA